MSPSPVNLISQPKGLGVSNPNQVQLESGGDNEQFSKTLAKAQQDRQDYRKTNTNQSDNGNYSRRSQVEQDRNGRSVEEISAEQGQSSRDASSDANSRPLPAASASDRQDDSDKDPMLPDGLPSAALTDLVQMDGLRGQLDRLSSQDGRVGKNDPAITGMQSATGLKTVGMNWLSGISDRFFQTELPSDSAKAADVMALAASGNGSLGASRGEGVALGLREALSRLRLQPEGDAGRANAAMAGFNGDRFLSSGASGRNALAEQMLAANLESSAALLKGGGQSDAGSWGRQGPESAFQIASLTESGRLAASEVKPAFATLLNNASQQADVVRQMGQHAKMMLAGKMQFAELKLTPANLGTVEILMKQENDQTSLVFFSKNPAVREAIENNMLRLQKNFEADGLMLGQASVSDQSLAEHKEQMAAESDTQRSSIDVGTQEEQVAAELPLAVEQDGMLNLWV